MRLWKIEGNQISCEPVGFGDFTQITEKFVRPAADLAEVCGTRIVHHRRFFCMRKFAAIIMPNK